MFYCPLLLFPGHVSAFPETPARTAVTQPSLMLSVPFALTFPSPRPLLCLANPRSSHFRYFHLCEVLPKTLGQSPASFLSVPVAGRSGTCSAARPTRRRQSAWRGPGTRGARGTQNSRRVNRLLFTATVSRLFVFMSGFCTHLRARQVFILLLFFNSFNHLYRGMIYIG